jgi:hypothetical protein
MTGDLCKSCGARVQWAMTERGKRMPVDYEPSPAGNILLQYRMNQPPLAVYLGADAIEHLDGLQRHRLFTSHFATCPQAKRWRKK